MPDPMVDAGSFGGTLAKAYSVLPPPFKAELVVSIRLCSVNCCVSHPTKSCGRTKIVNSNEKPVQWAMRTRSTHSRALYL